MATTPPLTFVGFDSTAAQVLANAVDGPVGAVVADIDALTALPDDAVILLTGACTATALRESAIRLRSDRFIWNPAVALAWTEPPSADDLQWALWWTSFPPDVTHLASLVQKVVSLSEPRRRELLLAGGVALRDELSRLRWALSEAGGYAASGIQEQLRGLLDLVGADHAARVAVAEQSAVMQGLVSLPVLQAGDLERLVTAVAKAESTLRKIGASQPLVVKLHQMSNRARLDASVAAETYQERARSAAARLKHMPFAETAALGAKAPTVLCVLERQLGPTLDALALNGSGAMAQAKAAFAGIEAELSELGVILGAARRSDHAASGMVQSVLVVEDEDRWRQRVLDHLEELSLGVPVAGVATFREAEEHLVAAGGPVLVLVDLGLPLDSAAAARGEVDLDAGLQLIRNSVDRNERHRFMVLTATADFPNAVQHALQGGVDPSDYIQKDPAVWEEQLRSRVVLAVAARPAPAFVEVLSHTDSTIRVNGLEFQLTRKPFMVLDCLAFNARRRWWEPRDLCEELLEKWPDVEADTPGGGLSPKQLKDHIDSIREAVQGAFAAVGRPQDAPELISYAKGEGYSLCVQTRRVEADTCGLADAPRRRRVLVVEDDPRWSESIADNVADLGFEVRRAASLAQALRILDEWSPDLVSLDLQIPCLETDGPDQAHERNSVELMRAMRDRCPECRVAVLTSIAFQTTVMLELLREGVALSHYLSKLWPAPLERLRYSLYQLSMEQERGVRIIGGTPVKVHRLTVHDGDPPSFAVAGFDVPLPPNPLKLFVCLVENANTPVTRERLRDAIWPDPDSWPEDYEASLNNIVSRLRDAIKTASRGQVDSRDVVISGDGVYRVQGIVVRE